MTWGDRSNISKLVEAIARHLLVFPNNDWKQTRILNWIPEAAIALNNLLSSFAASIYQGLMNAVSHGDGEWEVNWVKSERLKFVLVYRNIQVETCHSPFRFLERLNLPPLHN